MWLTSDAVDRSDRMLSVDSSDTVETDDSDMTLDKLRVAYRA